MKNWGVGDNLGERVNLANDSSWHLSSYETNTCTFNSYSLKAFQDYFWPTKTIVIYTPEDRDFMPDSGEGDSPNFANFENFILEVEYEPKAASFLTLPSELIINSQNQVTVGTLGEGFTYKLRLELGSQFLETEEFSE